MVFTQSRGFVLGASFGLQCRSLRCRVLVRNAADTASLAARFLFGVAMTFGFEEKRCRKNLPLCDNPRMEIIRITAQQPESLSEFYARESAECRARGDSFAADYLALMTDLLIELQTVDAQPVFGVTSHFRLRLIQRDDYKSPTIAVVWPVIDGPEGTALDISYPMPTAHAPWDRAWVHGLAFDVPMAIPMVQAALRRSANAS